MKNKMFMFLIVFSLMLGIFGSVYAYDGSFISGKVVPTVLKISGDLNVSGVSAGNGYGLIVSVNNQLIGNGNPVITGSKEEVSAFLRNGFFTDPFSLDQTGVSDKNISVSVVFTLNNTSLIHTMVQIPNPNYVEGYLMADNVVDLSITTSKLVDKSVTTSKLADNSVTTSKLADNSVTTSKLVGKSVNLNKMDIYLPAGYCPNDNASLQYDLTSGKLKWSATHLCASG